MPQESRHWPAPAKLNLLLNITGRRPDGYHELQTVFQFIDFSDELSFTLNDQGRLSRSYDIPGVDAEQDLILRAARLLQQHTGCRQGATIGLVKRLPMGGGLGGGSSDAATVLVALNSLWGMNLSVSELCRLGLSLGADVPVFVHGQATWAEGVGERFTPLVLPEPWYVVLIPDAQVATGKIFSSPELTRNAPPLKIRDFLEGQGFNLCEPVVRRLYPAVDQAMRWLERFRPARLTGTGACVFAAVASAREGQEIVRQLPAAWRGLVARGLNQSPLQARLGAGEQEKTL